MTSSFELDGFSSPAPSPPPSPDTQPDDLPSIPSPNNSTFLHQGPVRSIPLSVPTLRSRTRARNAIPEREEGPHIVSSDNASTLPDIPISGPLPFKHPALNAMRTLYDIARISLPDIPPPYDTAALHGTKQVSATEGNCDTVDKLRKVVFLENLVNQFNVTVADMLKKVKIGGDVTECERILATIHPFYTSRHLPPKICSEKDIELWSHATLFRPALSILHAVIAGKIINEPGDVPEYPYISSCVHDNVIPDGMFVSETSAESHPQVTLTIEQKTPSAFLKAPGVSHLTSLQMSPLLCGLKKGAAMKFNWPLGTEGTNHQTRFLVQVCLVLVSKFVHNLTY